VAERKHIEGVEKKKVKKYVTNQYDKKGGILSCCWAMANANRVDG
jgi:hypothetical protein